MPSKQTQNANRRGEEWREPVKAVLHTAGRQSGWPTSDHKQTKIDARRKRQRIEEPEKTAERRNEGRQRETDADKKNLQTHRKTKKRSTRRKASEERERPRSGRPHGRSRRQQKLAARPNQETGSKKSNTPQCERSRRTSKKLILLTGQPQTGYQGREI